MDSNKSLVILAALICLLLVVNSKLKLDRESTLAEQGLQQCYEKVGDYPPKIVWKKECND